MDRALGWCMTAAMLFSVRGAACCKDTVAVVASLTGPATIELPHGGKSALSSLDWLVSGSVIELGKGATANLILLNGHRFELHAGAKATVTADELVGVTGDVRELPPFPPLPKLVPIANANATVLAASTVRGKNDMRNLYPHIGTATPPWPLKLQFSAVPGASLYSVTLRDDKGHTVLSVRTKSTSVDVAKGLLTAGAHYAWEARAIGKSGILGKGSADFVTVAREDLEDRERVAGALQETDEASRLSLLGAVDFRLGMVAEASQEFDRALRLTPGDPGIQQAANLARMALAEPAK